MYRSGSAQAGCLKLQAVRTALTTSTALISLAFSAGVAFADQVALTSRDGNARIVGELISEEDGVFLVQTSIGQIRVDGEQFLCEGEGCPDESDDDDDVDLEFDYAVNMVASAGIADQLLPVIAQGIAAEYDANVEALDSAGAPLPEEIGRPLPGGPREDDDDDDDDDGDSAEGEEEEEGEDDIISIVLRNDDDEPVLAYSVVIAEEEDAIEELAEGDVEIIFLDEPAEEDDIEEVAEGGGGVITSVGQERVIAVEGLVAAVSQENPINRIKAEQLPLIFSGEITNWSELGGPNAPINVYSFDNANAAFHYVEEMVLEPADEELGDDVTVIQTMRELTSKIAADPNGIGVVPYTNQRGTKAVPIESQCGIINAANEFSIKTEEYLLQRRFYAYNRASVGEKAQEFLDYLDGDEIDGLVQKAGFNDLSVVVENENSGATRTQELIKSTTDAFELGIMRNLLLDMVSSRRLSSTFRFSLGSSRLDVRARDDVRRIANYITENRPSEVLFVGFTDSVGSFEANARLSVGRSASVLSAVANQLSSEVLSNVKLSQLGYGELSPVACNEDVDGRRINRRVEVWIR